MDPGPKRPKPGEVRRGLQGPSGISLENPFFIHFVSQHYTLACVYNADWPKNVVFMAKNKQYSIYFSEGGVDVKFAVLEDVSQALQLVIALHQSSNVSHIIQVKDSDGVVIVDILNFPKDAD